MSFVLDMDRLRAQAKQHTAPPVAVSQLSQPLRAENEPQPKAEGPGWSDETVRAFLAYSARLILRGFDETEAEELAERLTRRDLSGDDRRVCLECARLRGDGRCAAAAQGRAPFADSRAMPVQTVLQRCDFFQPIRKGQQ